MREVEAAQRAAAVRRGVGIFAPDDRALVAVRGSDRVRWLEGMVSNRVGDRVPGPERSGCYALLLTPQGRIVADLHVVAREDEIWLETWREILPDALAHLERYRVADDVALEDRSADVGRLALEGPRAAELLSAVAGRAPRAAPDCVEDQVLDGAPLGVGAWGWSGAPAFQLFAPAGALGALRTALVEAGARLGLVEGDADTLEVLRIEAGTPRLGAELSRDVLPAEALLVGRAVRLDKGCYTGQEIVARMESRAQAGHWLVGFRFEADAALPALGAEVASGSQRVGSLTSVCRSALAGPIGLGYVRRGYEAPETGVHIGGVPARVAPLPFVAPAP